MFLLKNYCNCKKKFLKKKKLALTNIDKTKDKVHVWFILVVSLFFET